MQDDLSNRMALTRRRGPSPAAADPTPLPAEVIEIDRSRLGMPPLLGVRCPGCGRGMIPERDAVSNGKTYARCRLCPARMVLTFDPTGRPVTIRLV